MYKEAIIDGLFGLQSFLLGKQPTLSISCSNIFGSVVQLSQIRLFGSLWTIGRYWRFLNLGGLSSPVYVHVETKLKTAAGLAEDTYDINSVLAGPALYVDIYSLQKKKKKKNKTHERLLGAHFDDPGIYTFLFY